MVADLENGSFLSKSSSEDEFRGYEGQKEAWNQAEALEDIAALFEGEDNAEQNQPPKDPLALVPSSPQEVMIEATPIRSEEADKGGITMSMERAEDSLGNTDMGQRLDIPILKETVEILRQNGLCIRPIPKKLGGGSTKGKNSKNPMKREIKGLSSWEKPMEKVYSSSQGQIVDQ